MVCPRPLETGCAGIGTLKCASWVLEALVLSFLTSGVAAVVLLASVLAGAVVLVLLLVGGSGVEPADDVALMDMRAFQGEAKAAV